MVCKKRSVYGVEHPETSPKPHGTSLKPHETPLKSLENSCNAPETPCTICIRHGTPLKLLENYLLPFLGNFNLLLVLLTLKTP